MRLMCLGTVNPSGFSQIDNVRLERLFNNDQTLFELHTVQKAAYLALKRQSMKLLALF